MILEFNCKEHFFHKDCLKEWIKKSEYCPLCKFDLLHEYRKIDEDDDEDDDEEEIEDDNEDDEMNP